MTFLNPFVLFGLAAAAIPVIIHLLNLRKLRTIEFSTLTFLKELQQTKIRKLKLRQLLLLLLRTLLIILIVLAFARPALRGTILGSIGTHAHSSVVFILDDSFSLEASDDHGKLFKQAKDVAGKLTDVLKEGDEAFLIKLSDLPQATIEPATHDFKALRTLIDESQISTIRRPMEDALRLSAKLLSLSKNANKEVYIISDFQRTLFPANLPHNQETVPSLFDNSVKFFSVNLGSKETANTAIDSVEVRTTILEKDKPASFYTSVRSFGTAPLKDYVVSLFLDGVRASQSNVNIDPRGSSSLIFTALPKRTGFIKGYVELENDAIEQDNRRYFTMYIPNRINVAMVAGSPNDVRFPLLALHAGIDNGNQSLLNIQQITPQQLPFLELKKVDVLLLSNIKSFSANDVDRIKGFVEHGGGLLLFPGSDINIANYNSTLLPSLNIQPIDGITGNQQNILSFNKIDVDHPLFATVFESEPKGKRQEHQSVESPGITTTIKRQSGKQARTVISLNDGTPFLTEHTLGEGRILFFSVAPTLPWSDFPLKGVFAPLMYRSLIYVSSHSGIQEMYLTGDEPIVALRRSTDVELEKQFKVISPDGTEELIRPSAQSSSQQSLSTSMRFGIKRLTLPGIYELKNGSTTLSLFAANIDSRESDGLKISNEELEKFWSHLDIPLSTIQLIQFDEHIQSAILQSRFGVELWKYCIGLALFLALVEMFIARDSRKASEHVS